MCGIAGIIQFNNSSNNIIADAQRMSTLLRHRGPDDEGYIFISDKEVITAGGDDTAADVWRSGLAFSPKENIHTLKPENYFLAYIHRRLSIIDTSAAGHQPMQYANSRYWITYNGEIYNYIELRNTLSEKGYTFRTASDTEVLLAAYTEWGTDCVNHFNGMWAFAIYDADAKTIFLSRDRIGVKPLYYYADENSFVFASELKAIAPLARVKTGINPQAVFDYFALREIETDSESMFRNIFELPPAHNLTLQITSGKTELQKYYTLQYNTQFETFDLQKSKELTAKTEALFRNAVQLRLRSDVPVASCLSGGIDSSSIVCMMRELLPEKAEIQTFTAGFADKQYDESNWAEYVVQKAKTKSHIVQPTLEELIADMESLMYSQDIPIWSTSTYAQFRVMRKAKEAEVKVLLNGQGSDELFGGYPNHRMALWMELLQHGKFKTFNTEFETGNAQYNRATLFLKLYLKFYGVKKLPVAVQNTLKKKYYPEVAYMQPELWHAYQHRLQLRNSNKQDTLNSMLHNEISQTLLKGFLKCEDRCSMWYSVESRTPFSDDMPLIEFAMQIPAVYKIHNGTSKYILRKAMENILPKEIIERKDKMGYVTPNNLWVSKMKNEMLTLFDSSMNDFIQTDKLKKDYNTYFSKPDAAEDGSMFKFFSFGMWKKVHGM